MFDAPDRCVTRDVVPGEHWGADPCSSKDSASRMNSPRNSKSSGTPQISPEPKQLCFGAEVDMEEDDGSSHSGASQDSKKIEGINSVSTPDKLTYQYSLNVKHER